MNNNNNNSNNTNKTVLVSSPGKILITGGYLVLDSKYSGSVIGSNAKFLVGIKESKSSTNITAISCQFEDKPWSYEFNGEAVTPKLEQTKNPFLDITIPLVYKYLLGIGVDKETLKIGIKIYCFSDNDFYSQVNRLKYSNLPQTLEGLSQLEPCGVLDTSLSEVSKTGLGSSATLVTSLVGALLSYFLNLTNLNDYKNIIHNLSQLSHSIAQGKLGSGFDVSAASFGNQIYSTFQSEWVKGFIQEYSKLSAQEFSKTINNQSLWDTKVTQFELPYGINLTLADIQHGSHTPSMVSKLLNWRKINPTIAGPIWGGLNNSNLEVIGLLNQLQSLYVKNSISYLSTIEWASKNNFNKWQTNSDSKLNTEVINTLIRVRQTFSQVRAHFRELTKLAEVPIEPSSQTELLNKMEELDGVLIAGVPGAGGYDAVFTLTLGLEPINKLQELWKHNNVIPLLQGGAQSDQGVQLEADNTIYWRRLEAFHKESESKKYN